MKYSPTAPAFLLSPHLDDAVLSCWKLLADDKQDIEVITVFAGSPPIGRRGDYDALIWSRFAQVREAIPDGWDSATMFEQRKNEDTSALATCNRRGTYFDLLDSQYLPFGSRHHKDSETFENSLKAHIPEASTLYIPAAIAPVWQSSPHPDHLWLREQTLARDRNVPVRCYADLPYALRLPKWRRSSWRSVRSRHGRPVDRQLHWPPELPQQNVLELSEDEIDAKLRAINCYVTQTPLLNQVWQDLAHLDLRDRALWHFEAISNSEN